MSYENEYLLKELDYHFMILLVLEDSNNYLTETEISNLYNICEKIMLKYNIEIVKYENRLDLFCNKFVQGLFFSSNEDHTNNMKNAKESIKKIINVLYTNKISLEEKETINKIFINYLIHSIQSTFVFDKKILNDHILDYKKDIIDGYVIFNQDLYKLLHKDTISSEKRRITILKKLISHGVIIDNLTNELIMILFTFNYDFEKDQVLCNRNRLLMKDKELIEKAFNSLSKKARTQIIKIFNTIQDKIIESLNKEAGKRASKGLYIGTFIKYYRIIVGEFNDKLSLMFDQEIKKMNNQYLNLFPKS